MPLAIHLSRRERQIMDIVYELSEVSAKDIESRLPDAPSYSAIRAMLAKLEKKGFLEHKEQNLKYIYFPTVDHKSAQTNAINRLLKTFFDGSASQAMSAMLDMSMQNASDDDLEKLQSMIESAKTNKAKSDK
ncbi:MAG: BlaI/MecI/CopY family transcriptional regulator [Pseudohongiellaceae bacterium]